MQKFLHAFVHTIAASPKLKKSMVQAMVGKGDRFATVYKGLLEKTVRQEADWNRYPLLVKTRLSPLCGKIAMWSEFSAVEHSRLKQRTNLLVEPTGQVGPDVV